MTPKRSKLPYNSVMKTTTLALLAAYAALGLGGVFFAQAQPTAARLPKPVSLVNGKRITPLGEHVHVGSFPTNVVLSPEGKFVIVSSLGARSQLTVLEAKTGAVVSTLTPKAIGTKRPGLYLGLAFGPEGVLYAARGSDDVVSAFTLSVEGQLTETEQRYPVPKAAGVALGGGFLAVTSSEGNPKDKLKGSMTLIALASGKSVTLGLPGYPLGAAYAAGKFYVASEQAGGVDVVDPTQGTVLRRIETGAQSTHVLAASGKIYVANAGSDTVSVIDPTTDRVLATVLLRPAALRGLPSVTPMGLAVAGDALYVACADLNAVAVVDLKKNSVRGYLPAAWYPTATIVAGGELFVASAKGVQLRNPNGKPVAIARGIQPQYIQNIIEGTVSRISLAAALPKLPGLTAQTLENNAIKPDLLKTARTTLKNPGIEYVIYIIKENRTYDQVLGDLGKGNGDPSLTLFGRDVTPNQHALAERFVLLDNFYCSAEVSGDGWSFSTQGMASEYAARNVPYGYTGKTRPYDYEGTNNGVAPDRIGIRDVSMAPGGYLWDKAIEKRVSLRNYGVYTDSETKPRTTAEEGTTDERTAPLRRSLLGVTSDDFRVFDTSYADSEAWVKHGLTPAPRQKAKYGRLGDPARTTVWRREYEALLNSDKMPRLMMLRLGRDHTAGTSAGQSSPRAMVADNDYAVGQVVETVSHSPLWKKTAIFVLEDDAQNGYDHVDAHRSTAFVISPFVAQASLDSRFFNTDSVLRTIEVLLGIEPMNLYDAAAPALAVFGAQPTNAAPYSAILPSREIIGQVNGRSAYRSQDSERLLNPLVEESEPDEELNEILWHAIKGVKVPPPPRRYGITSPRN